VTTLLDPVAYPVEALAELCLQRCGALSGRREFRAHGL
jgi:hypothetical protein